MPSWSGARIAISLSSISSVTCSLCRPGQPRQLWAPRDTSRSLGHPGGGKGEWPPGPGIPGWGERVQCPDLGLHGDAPPSGSLGGCQLGPGGQPRGSPREAPLEVLCDRRQLEDAYVAIHGTPKPRLEFQGSDGYLKKQWRLIAKGELGYIPAKHIVSALPEEGERPSSTHKKITVGGWDREDEEEVRSHPTSRRQLERLQQTLRTTLRRRCHSSAT